MPRRATRGNAVASVQLNSASVQTDAIYTLQETAKDEAIHVDVELHRKMASLEAEKNSGEVNTK